MMRYYVQWGIAYVFAAASAVMASLFGFLSSVGPYAVAKAAVLCLVAFAGCHGPAWASRLRQAYGIGAAFLGGLAAFACLIVTLWGGLGTMASGSAEVRAERVKAAADAALDRGALERILGQRQRLPTTRPSSAIQPLLSRASEGTKLRANLEAELATALEAERLDGEATALNERLRHAPPPLEADPEASAFSQLTGIPLATSAALRALLVSLALEAAAMVAMLVAWAERREARPAHMNIEPELVEEAREWQRQPSRAAAAHRKAISPPAKNIIPIPRVSVFGSVKKFAAACVMPFDGERLEVRALLTRYQHWCSELGLPPCDLARFLDEIEKIFAVETEGSKVYCVGVRLAA